MSGIYWLASYPKSGNTWLRALLTNYRRDGAEPASINELDGAWIAPLRELFDEYVGIESESLSRDQIDHYRPAVFDRLAAAAAEPLFLKIHDAFTRNAEQRPIVSKRATAGVIYIIRNPLDVAVSYAYHRNEPVDRTIDAMACEDATLAGSDKPGDQLPQTLLSWSGHVRSWVDEPELERCVVRYEDLSLDADGVFSGILRFIGLEPDPRRLAKAVERSRFEQLRSQEVALGFDERQPTAVSFFRLGRSGSWREHLTRAQIDRLIADHRDVMLRFGYLSPSGRLLC